MGHAHKILSVLLVLGLLTGGLPLFFSQGASAAYDVDVTRTEWPILWDGGNGYLTITVQEFEDEGGKPLANFPLVVEWDVSWTDLNPLSGTFLGTISRHERVAVTTSAMGVAEVNMPCDTGVHIANVWLKSASTSYSYFEHYLGDMTDRHSWVTAKTMPSGATQYNNQRADTLGIIQDWYDMEKYQYTTNLDVQYMDVVGSRSFPGSAKMSVTYLPNPPYSLSESPTPSWLATPTSSIGTITDRVTTNSPALRSGGSSPTFNNATVKLLFGELAEISGGWGSDLSTITGSTTNYAEYVISHCISPYPIATWTDYKSDSGRPYRVLIDNEVVFPESGGWYTGTSSVSDDVILSLPTDREFSITVHLYSKSSTNNGAIAVLLLPCQTATFVLSGLSKADTVPVLTLWSGKTVTVDLTGRWNTVQIGGYATTLTSETLVPVHAYIKDVYPLVISNPRFDRTPIANANNDFWIDVYNIKDLPITQTIYLALTADNGTQVWATTVGSSTYPAWVNESKFTAVHLTNVYISAAERRQYTLTVTSGYATTTIPVVFYPSTLDPAVVYPMKYALDDILEDYGILSTAARVELHNWALDMSVDIDEMADEIDGLKRAFTAARAGASIRQASEAIDQAAILIDDLKVWLKDETFTDWSRAKTAAAGAWNLYHAALGFKESAMAYEAGDNAFGNSTYSDATYAFTQGKGMFGGTHDEGGDSGAATSFWISTAIAAILAIVAFVLIYPRLVKALPKRRGRAGLIQSLMTLAIVAVIAAVIGYVAFLASTELVLGVSGWLETLPFGLFPGE